MSVRLVGPSCSCGCGRPARELGGFSTACWMALTPAERRFLVWCDDLTTDEPCPDTALLEQLWDMPCA